MTPGWGGLAFTGTWRRYQALALAAFDADVAAGRRSTHIVAPPGSGKTVIGLEIARRLGAPALVLCPTTAIAGQWTEKLGLFGASDLAGGAAAGGAAGVSTRGAAVGTAGGAAVVGEAAGVAGGAAGGDAPLHVLTYQAVCRTGDPGGALTAAALRRLAAERSADTGVPVDVALAEIEALEGAAARRVARDVAKVTATLKHEIARGEGDGALSVADLLSPAAAERVAALRAAGVRTVVLDECHHLISLWGYLVRAVVEALGADVHVIGLTATSPEDVTSDEAALYLGLLGEVDFQIPTPAVVKEGHLAPYQELALFTTPLESELAWLRERHTRFEELLDRLHDPAPAGEEDLAFPNWVIGRLRFRDTEDGAAQLSFAALHRRSPALARAGLRYLHAGGLELPPDAPRGEGFDEPPDLDDWLVLLDDWALRCLRAHPGDAADALWERLSVGLADLDYLLTRRGIRPGASPIDRVLVHSGAKPLLVADALDTEAGARGDRLRAVVLCDTEAAPRGPEDSPLALSGGARGMVMALGADERIAWLKPLLLTGRTVGCLREDAAAVVAALREVLPEAVGATLRVVDGAGAGDPPGETRSAGPADPPNAAGASSGRRSPDGGLCEIVADHPSWGTAVTVPAVTRLFVAGAGRVLVGTRGLLGEGWDCPEVNVLIDATSVAASISVRQMRGRSLRLDPGDPKKLSSNWDVVCIAPELQRGQADFRRFVRRHTHLHAPCEDGSIESGVSHVHPELSPFAPPPADHYMSLNVAALERAGDPDAARERWAIGVPYRGEDLPVLLVRATAASGSRGSAPAPVAVAAPARGLAGGAGLAGWAGTAALGAGVVGAVAAGAVVGVVAVPIAVACAGGGWWRAKERERRGLGPVALERTAAAVLDAYRALGEVSEGAAASLAFTPRPGGHVRCALTDGSAEENRRFSEALAEALQPAAGQRYVVSRPIVTGPAGAWRRLARGMAGRDDAVADWHPVPSDLARNKGRAEAYAVAWRRWVAPSAELAYTVADGVGRERLLAASGAADYTASRRTLWV